MLTRDYFDLDPPVSVLGMGCMRLPVKGEYRDIDEEKAAQIIEYAYGHGVNYFDTAYPYHDGASEGFLGRALAKYPRDSYYYATKLPLWTIKNTPDATVDDAERIFNEQLTRSGLEYFDFYLLHNIFDESLELTKRLKLFDFIEKKKRQGYVRRIGFSFHDSPAVLEDTLSSFEFDFAQIQLNYLDWTLQDAKRQYELLCEHSLPVVVMEPVRGGRLATLSPDAAGLLLAAEPERTVASWAIRYAASLPGVMTVLSGMTALEQAVDNVDTMTDFTPLSDAERDLLSRAVEVFGRNGFIPCTGCEYCLPCPAGVAVPGVFDRFNTYAINRDAEALKKSFEPDRYWDGTGGPDRCAGCGECLSKCPQHIDIPARMADINALL